MRRSWVRFPLWAPAGRALMSSRPHGRRTRTCGTRPSPRPARPGTPRWVPAGQPNVAQGRPRRQPRTASDQDRLPCRAEGGRRLASSRHRVDRAVLAVRAARIFVGVALALGVGLFGSTAKRAGSPAGRLAGGHGDVGGDRAVPVSPVDRPVDRSRQGVQGQPQPTAATASGGCRIRSVSVASTGPLPIPAFPDWTSASRSSI